MHDNISPYIMLVFIICCWGFAWVYMFKQAKQIENRTERFTYAFFTIIFLLIFLILLFLFHLHFNLPRFFVFLLFLPVLFRRPFSTENKKNKYWRVFALGIIIGLLLMFFYFMITDCCDVIVATDDYTNTFASDTNNINRSF